MPESYLSAALLTKDEARRIAVNIAKLAGAFAQIKIAPTT
jgi:hypothetical protein